MTQSVPGEPDTPLARLLAERTRARTERAERIAGTALHGLRAAGYAAELIGSLATGRFRLHSDIDLFVSGSITSADRVAVERIVADALRGAAIPYDLIFACDLTPAQREAFSPCTGAGDAP